MTDLIFEFGSPTNFLQAVEARLLLCMAFLTAFSHFGQKAEQRAKGFSFHALPPQTQMFTSKTSPLVQVEA